MLLSHETTIQWSSPEANIVGHMCYAAYKLWNVCNYERQNFRKLGFEKMPDWYSQKARYKDNLWFKSLPSQTAQEVCKLLDKSWKSFFALERSGGIQNPRPPKFKQEGITITYMQHAVVHEAGSCRVRLALPKRLKEHMGTKYGVCEKFLYLENKVFQSTDSIKQLKIYPPDRRNVSRMIVIYEVLDVDMLPENGHDLSIDLGLHNLFTCFDSNGKSFIVGRKYLDLCHYYDKEIARIQSQWGKCQAVHGVEYPKISKHLSKVYEKKRNCIQDYLHKVTRYIVSYCVANEIHTVVVGDITNIRKGNDLGALTNQKLHALPYKKIYGMLEYKLTGCGIRLVLQEEAYTSQCAPHTPEVSKEYGGKANRIRRGLYQEGLCIYNADAVGAFNILRKYNAVSGREQTTSVSGLMETKTIKVAV